MKPSCAMSPQTIGARWWLLTAALALAIFASKCGSDRPARYSETSLGQPAPFGHARGSTAPRPATQASMQASSVAARTNAQESSSQPAEASPPATMSLRATSSEPLILSRGVSSQNACTDCHCLLGGLTHPVDVLPSMVIPPQWPLTGGQLVCTTCHLEISHNARGLGAMLRDGAECEGCHAPGGSFTHALSPLHAHSGSGIHVGPVTSAGLNQESVDCVGCHDALAAAFPASHPALADNETTNHVGAAYELPDVSWGGLVEASRLDPSVRIFDSRIQCASCHSIYTRTTHRLVKPSMHSELCTCCHVR